MRVTPKKINVPAFLRPRSPDLETFVWWIVRVTIAIGIALYVWRWATTADAKGADVLDLVWGVLP